MNIFLEDTWDATDVIDYCHDHGYNCTVLSPSQLRSMESEDFIKYTYLCNTDIVQEHLRKLALLHSHSYKNNINNLVPDTYESTYTFGRTITKMPFSDVKKISKISPIFIKPLSNDKSFDGQIYYQDDYFLGQLPRDDEIVYTSECVKFMAEYRLLIGYSENEKRMKLYGHGLISGHNMDDIFQSYHTQSYINKVIQWTPEKQFRCVDIGYTKTGWQIVEINPPFSLDDHHIPLHQYMDFVIGACNNIKNQILLESNPENF